MLLVQRNHEAAYNRPANPVVNQGDTYAFVSLKLRTPMLAVTVARTNRFIAFHSLKNRFDGAICRGFDSVSAQERSMQNAEIASQTATDRVRKSSATDCAAHLTCKTVQSN